MKTNEKYNKMTKNELINLIKKMKFKVDVYNKIYNELNIKRNMFYVIKGMKKQNEDLQRENWRLQTEQRLYARSNFDIEEGGR